MNRTRRFIPAHAGNTAGVTASAFWASVHPRPRGEHTTAVRARTIKNGSSPPTRGTRTDGFSWTRQDRFIPAHAGNT